MMLLMYINFGKYIPIYLSIYIYFFRTKVRIVCGVDVIFVTYCKKESVFGNCGEREREKERERERERERAQPVITMHHHLPTPVKHTLWNTHTQPTHRHNEFLAPMGFDLPEWRRKKQYGGPATLPTHSLLGKNNNMKGRRR